MSRLAGLRRALGRADAAPDVPPTAGGEPDLPIDTVVAEDGVGPDLDPDGVTLLVLLDASDVGSARVDAAIARGRGTATQVVMAVHDVHAGPHTRHAVVSSPPGVDLASPRVSATVGGAIAAALPRVRGGRLVVLDAAFDVPDGIVRVLLDALADGVTAAQAVVRDTSDVVASAGAVLPLPGHPPASFLAGFPPEDARALSGARVFAAEEPVLAIRTGAVGVPPRTIDPEITIAGWTRAAADASGGAVVLVDAGRVYRPAPETPRRVDTDAETVVRSWAGRHDDAFAETLASAGLRVDGLQPGPAGRPVALRTPVPRLVRTDASVRDRGERLRWSIKIAAHPGARGDDWGDTFFARDLAAALRRLGQEVVVDHRESHVRPFSEHLDDVSLVLRGLDDTPVTASALNVLWVISHPDLVTPAELGRFDLRFAAGPTWAARTGAATGLPIATLLQATDPGRFHPGEPDPRLGADVVFVGKTRAVERPVVRDALAAGLDLTVWGEGWAGLLDAPRLRGEFLPNDELPALYRTARIVLNDHWPDMADGGFLSNRLFDAAASGAFVVSDDVVGIDEAFHGAVRVYRGVEDLRRLAASGDAVADTAERAERGRRIGEEHSFDRRASTLLDAVRRELARR